MNKKTLQALEMAKTTVVSNQYYDLILRLAKGDLSPDQTYEMPSGAYTNREGLVKEIERLEALLKKPNRPKPAPIPARAT